MARKFLKYGQVESILMHLQNVPIYYATYKKEEILIELKKRSDKGNRHRRKNLNIRRSLTLEHYFGGEETQKATRRRKTLRWILCFFKQRRRNFMKGKIYLKQQLLKDIFAVKRYGKGLLIQIIEEVYKIITNKVFTDDEDSSLKRIEPHKKINTQWGKTTVEIWWNSQKRK